jgi:hypothetical protein
VGVQGSLDEQRKLSPMVVLGIQESGGCLMSVNLAFKVAVNRTQLQQSFATNKWAI